MTERVFDAAVRKAQADIEVRRQQGFSAFEHTSTGRVVWARPCPGQERLLQVYERRGYEFLRVDKAWFERYHRGVSQ